MSKCLDQIKDWFISNRLSCNLDKTKFLLIGKGRKFSNHNLSFCSNILKPVKSTRNLCVFFDFDLSFK